MATKPCPHATAQRLFLLAPQADARLTAVLTARTGRDRWTMIAADYTIPEVQDALREKFNADHHWLGFLRQAREGKAVSHDDQ